MGSRQGAEKSAAAKVGVSVQEWRARRAAGERWCYCCRLWLPAGDFSADASRATQHASNCRKCQSFKSVATRYGVSLEEARRLRSGDGTCAICGRNQKLEVDHNHATGRVRGVLCSRCNGALGQFLDDIGMLKRAIAYLEINDG